jgi:hypothetical protein
MQLETIRLRTRIMRAAMTAGFMVLLALQPESARVVEAAGARVGVAGVAGTGWAGRGTIASNLVFSDQARRYLSLQYQSYPTEFMGCMLGEVRGTTVVVSRIAPADVDPSHSGRTHVVPTQSCEQAGWAETVGMVHSHPDGRYCWYFFPGTSVLTSDGQSFLRQPYPVDAIMCGDRVVWISRDMEQREVGMAGARELTASTTPAR